MATIRKRGASWQVQIRHSGKIAASKSFSAKRDAEQWAAEMEAQIGGNRLHPAVYRDTGLLTVRSLLLRYEETITASKKGAEKERFKIRVICRHPIADAAPWSVTGADVASYRDLRLRSVQSGTVRRELAVLQHCYGVARREWNLPSLVDPFENFRMPRASKCRERRISAGEEQLIEEALEASRLWYLAPIVRLAIETGMRRSEILALSRSSVSVSKRVAHLADTKNGEPRTVPLSPKALKILNGLRATSDKVFPITEGALRQAWAGLMATTKITNLRFHDLRHEAISRFFERGLSIAEVALISGHKDVRMLFRYTHLRAEDVARKLAVPVKTD